ncbi:hypothetical protein Tco_0250445 [Tanacetum coccineum]
MYMGIMPTKIELTLEQSQQGVSNDVLVSVCGNRTYQSILDQAEHVSYGRDIESDVSRMAFYFGSLTMVSLIDDTRVSSVEKDFLPSIAKDSFQLLAGPLYHPAPVLEDFCNYKFSPFVLFFYLFCLIKSRIPTNITTAGLKAVVSNNTGNITTVGPKAVVSDNKGNITNAGPKAIVSDNKGNEANAVKASTCWVWRPKQKVLDHVSRHNGASINFKRFDYVHAQGRSKRMTGNKSYLSDYEEIDGGFVAFGGDSKGGKITGKDTECVVLSLDFKLLDENYVLLRVPRKDNMYSVDLKNIVPSRVNATYAQLLLLSDYYCWKDYADRDEINDLSEKR